MTHLDALQIRLSHELERLSRARSEAERGMRQTWVKQVEREIAEEMAFLGMQPVATAEISDDDLLAALMA